MPYIEVKTGKKIGLTVIRKIAVKGCVSGILTTGQITGKAKTFLEENDIAYAENIPEKEFVELQTMEE